MSFFTPVSQRVGSGTGSSATFSHAHKRLFYLIRKKQVKRKWDSPHRSSNNNLPEEAFLASVAINHQNQSIPWYFTLIRLASLMKYIFRHAFFFFLSFAFQKQINDQNQRGNYIYETLVPINVCVWFITNRSRLAYLPVCGDKCDIIASHFMGPLQIFADRWHFCCFHRSVPISVIVSWSSFIAWQFIDVPEQLLRRELSHRLRERWRIPRNNSPLWKWGKRGEFF